MAIASINPSTGITIKTFTPLNDTEIKDKLNLGERAFLDYSQTSFVKRSQLLENTAKILETEKIELAKLMTLEMGKPLKSAIAEIEKCAVVCRYYSENSANFLADVHIPTDANSSFIKYQPLGIILAVMPWNFPFWQVFRFAAPALMAGNVGLLKHASNVPQCALAIENIMQKAGFPDGVFQTLLISASQVANVINDDRVKAATLTGSENAGISLAIAASKNIKKTVLELGGSDPFIVLASADLELAVNTAVTARMLNNGQSCIAAKRFIIQEQIADEFEKMLLEKFQKIKIGDPLELDTELGPLATVDILQELDQQVKTAANSGGKIITGGKPLEIPGNFYQPTIIKDIPTDQPIAKEEFFGPVALLFRVKNVDQAIKLANDTPFGLGASGWTNNEQEKQRLINEIEAGAVFINGMVKSDPRLPFGGIKRSGYGRELSIQGIHEFVNIKTVWMR
ncbi:NAD-dependent succinate-semialdehyde dehydrogenase [Anabaena sp. FACHB-1237]|uniref:NAD-dependent succinate-semialdehyde dehydrogenase n=1 Tax=Anabaena sp. FACHB-1237 TaxID=2692769 RepID=UPI001680A25F|nr:NAD-dependent succinate-semialdehyde dehydrogenase [Anabaena sp. FACHB-1237]MBD2136572.1 NAD-dependent succinate-semialdehyde dehydrogenase [Anabaena sp. FACHB-1237]